MFYVCLDEEKIWDLGCVCAHINGNYWMETKYIHLRRVVIFVAFHSLSERFIFKRPFLCLRLSSSTMQFFSVQRDFFFHSLLFRFHMWSKDREMILGKINVDIDN